MADMRTAGSSLLSYFTRHRTIANLLLVIMVTAGVFAFPNMRAQFFPDVVVDDVTISVNWSGAGPEDVDRAIVQVLGPALLAVEGVTGTGSRAREGNARITMEFEPGWNMARGADDIKVAVDNVVSRLPDDADDPRVVRSNWRDRVSDVVITGPVSVDQLGRFADEFTIRLFAEGVTRTTIRGLAAPSTIVEVASASLRKHDVSMAQISAAIAEEAEADPAGDVAAAGRVRTGVAKRSADEISGIVLRSNDDGSKLTVGDVALIRVEGIDRNRAYYVGENPAISVRVDRSASGDAIEIQDSVEAVAAEFQATLPAGSSIDLIRTRADAITGRLNILLENGLMGLALVVALLFLFLNARTAFWVAAGIPVAMAAAMGLMWAMGLTINMISLFALIITLGIVVDDAIVVGEHADFRARKLGESPVEAAENAAMRMFTPVFSATVTTVIAFFGLTIISGRFGDFIADIPFTVIAVLIASLIECFLILPNHMSHAIGPAKGARFSAARFVAGVVMIPAGLGTLSAVAWGFGTDSFAGLTAPSTWLLSGQIALGILVLAIAVSLVSRRARMRLGETLGGEWYDWPSGKINIGFDWVSTHAFRPLIRAVIWARFPAFALALVILGTQIVSFIDGDVRWRFFNAPERSSVTGNFAMAPGATREDSLDQMRAIQKAVEDVGKQFEEEHGTNPILYSLAEVGGNTGFGLAGADSKDPDQLGSIAVELIDADSRPYSSFTLLSALQEAVPNHPLVETISFRGWRSGPGGDALDVQFFGADADTLKAASEAMKTALAQYPEVSAVQDTLAYDKEELILDLTPQGQALGFTIDGLGRVLRNRLGGIEAASFPDGPRSATIRVELPEGELTADFLTRTDLRTPDGAYVPLSDIVTVDRRTGFSTVRRENGLLLISVTGDISEDDPERASQITTELDDTVLPKIAEDFGIEYRMSGLAEQSRSFLADATTGLILCLVGIFLTLAWIFSSWSRPVVVMAIIPFGLIGAIFGHWHWDVPLSMFSVIGIIGMVGIIINDSIVLVTTIDEYSKDRPLRTAIVDGTADRLRPVMLTTMTTVLGLTPLLFEGSNQAEFLKPTVITLVYGLGVGMVLVLIVVPTLLAIQEDVSTHRRSAKRAASAIRRGFGYGRGLGSVMVLGWGGVVALFAGTLGWALATGGLMPQLAALVPFEGGPVLALAAGAFIAGLLVWVLVLWALAILILSGAYALRPKAKA